jgi:hypothetical protein
MPYSWLSRPEPLLFLNCTHKAELNPDLWICSQELWPLDHRGSQWISETTKMNRVYLAGDWITMLSAWLLRMASRCVAFVRAALLLWSVPGSNWQWNMVQDFHPLDFGGAVRCITQAPLHDSFMCSAQGTAAFSIIWVFSWAVWGKRVLTCACYVMWNPAPHAYIPWQYLCYWCI